MASSDLNLLFGILALQMDFITRDDLIAGMNAWVLEKQKPLGQILRARGCLDDETHALLEALVRKHVAQHGGNPRQSLAALGPAGAGPVVLRLGRIGDADVRASLAHVRGVPGAGQAAGATLGPPPELSAAAGLRYRIVRSHARGGLGEVFVARDEELNREVALKEIQTYHAFDPQSRARFLLEAEITGGLEHPGIVPVYGLGQYGDGRPYYAMRFIRGESLEQAIEHYHRGEAQGRDAGTLAVEFRQLLGRFLDVCNAIAYAHSRSVVHRDLKPGNIMLGCYGETLVVDWGLAKPLAAAASQGHGAGTNLGENPLLPLSGSAVAATVNGSAVGTPQYMSPEQAEGRLETIGPASDVYSLGATLYHLLTGRAPFEGRDLGAVLGQVRQGDFAPPRQIRRAVPAGLDAVCRKAMAVAPADRYATPRALADEIEHWLADEPVSAYREPLTARLARWGRRHRPAVVAATALLVLAVAVLTASNVVIQKARRLALERKSEADRQRTIAQRNFSMACDAVDRMLTHVGEVDLADVPHLEPVRARLLGEAREFYGRFLEQQGTDTPIRVEAGRACCRLGDILVQQGDHATAARSYRQAIALLEPAADRLRERADAYHGLGILLKKSGRFADAETSFRTALELRRQALANSGDDPDCHRACADTLYHLGALLARLPERRQDDERAYREALREQEALVASGRDRPALRRDLARQLNNLGLLLTASGRDEEAEAAYRRAAAIDEELAKQFPTVAGYRWQLAAVSNNLAVLLAAARRPEADQLGGRALALLESLAADFPSVPGYRQELAATLDNLGNRRAAGGRPGEAWDAYRRAIELERSLTTDFPKVPDFRRRLANTCLNGGILRARSDPQDAERLFVEARSLQEQLLSESPGVPEYRISLGRTLSSQALFAIDQIHWAEARTLVDRAIEHHRSALSSRPENRECRRFLRDDYGILIHLQRQSGAHAQAAATASEFPALCPEDSQEYLRAAAFLAQCVWMSERDPGLSTEQKRQAKQAYSRQALDILQRGIDAKRITDAASLDRPAFATLGDQQRLAALRSELRHPEPSAGP